MLCKVFREELDRPSVEANAKVAEICFKTATSGTVPAATFFWLKTRAGWREINRQEHTGTDGRPIQLQQVEDGWPPIESFLLELQQPRATDGDAGCAIAQGADAGV